MECKDLVVQLSPDSVRKSRLVPWWTGRIGLSGKLKFVWSKVLGRLLLRQGWSGNEDGIGDVRKSWGGGREYKVNVRMK